jgi:hypothetical protein
MTVGGVGYMERWVEWRGGALSDEEIKICTSRSESRAN